ALLADIHDLLRGEPAPHRDRERLSEPDELSPSELRVLRYLPTSLTRPEIASELYVSINTVNTHLRNIYSKLGARDRSSAVQHARELRLLAKRTHSSYGPSQTAAIEQSPDSGDAGSPDARDDDGVATTPGLYTIRISGRLGATALSSLPSIVCELESGERVLTGLLEDRSALFGVIAQIEALGLELVELRRSEPWRPGRGADAG